jgi:hypothetical protein
MDHSLPLKQDSDARVEATSPWLYVWMLCQPLPQLLAQSSIYLRESHSFAMCNACVSFWAEKSYDELFVWRFRNRIGSIILPDREALPEMFGMNKYAIQAQLFANHLCLEVDYRRGHDSGGRFLVTKEFTPSARPTVML